MATLSLNRFCRTPRFGAPPLKPVGLGAAVLLQCSLIVGCIALAGFLAVLVLDLLKLGAGQLIASR